MRVQAAIVAVALLLLAAPLAAAESLAAGQGGAAPTTLYLHLNGIQDFTINAQAPAADHTANAGVGAGTHSLACFGADSGQGLVSGQFHTYRGYFQPELVEYNPPDGLGPRFGASRGVAHDVTFAAGSPLTLHWFLETSLTPDDMDASASVAPAVVPNVVVAATLRTGDNISIEDAAFDAGAIIAQGASPPTLLQPTAANHATDDRGRHVYEFTIELSPTLPGIPMAEGANLRVDVYVENPFCPDPSQAYFMPNMVRPHSSPDLRPRIEATLQDPLRSDLTYLTTATSFIVNARGGSVLGPYDVANAAIAVTGPDGQPVDGPSDSLEASVYTPCGHDCGHVTEHILVWAWPASLGPAPPGDYQVLFTYTNLQGSATGSETVTIRIASDAKAPGLPVGLLLLGIVALGLATRRP